MYTVSRKRESERESGREGGKGTGAQADSGNNVDASLCQAGSSGRRSGAICCRAAVATELGLGQSIFIKCHHVRNSHFKYDT